MSITKIEFEDRLVLSITLRRTSLAGLVIAALATLNSRRARGSPPLDNHLRRDIGLPPLERSKGWWEYR